MKRRILALVLCLALLTGVFVSCTPENNVDYDKAYETSDKTVNENENNEEVSTAFTVTDQAGRQIKFEKPAEKVVSVYYISTSLLVALGCEDKLVGIEKKAEERELYKLAAPQFLELPAVGSGKGISVEAIAALEPDVVVIPAKIAQSAESLEELGIKTVIVNPETQKNFVDCALLLGKVCGVEERAAELTAYYEAKANEMRELTANAERPKVYLSSASSYYSTCTSGMYQTELIEIAGGVSVSEEIEDTYWSVITPEQLFTWNPDYMFAVTDAEYTLDDIYADAALSSTAAVEEKRVYTFPSEIEAWDYPTASSVLGVMWLTSVLHPELYPGETYISEAKDFYKTFFDIEVSEKLLGF